MRLDLSADGTAVRTFAVLNDFNREGLGLEPGFGLPAVTLPLNRYHGSYPNSEPDLGG